MTGKAKYAFGTSHGTFGVTGLGVHIDGTFGTAHAVETMESLLEHDLRRRAPESAEAVDELLEEVTALDEGFEGEWLDDATDLLQEYTAPGYVWEWDGGDLILREEEDDQ